MVENFEFEIFQPSLVENKEQTGFEYFKPPKILTTTYNSERHSKPDVSRAGPS